MKAGIPETLLPLVRSVEIESELDEIGKSIPLEAFEALLVLTTGFTVGRGAPSEDRGALIAFAGRAR